MLFSVADHFMRTARHASFYLASGPEARPLIIFVHGWPELGFEACRDIRPVAVDVVAAPDDVPDVDPHAELDPPIWQHIGISLGHLALHFNRTTHRVDDTGELAEQAVTCRF